MNDQSIPKKPTHDTVNLVNESENLSEFHENICKTLASTSWYFFYEGVRLGEGLMAANGNDTSLEDIRAQFELEFRESVGQEIIDNISR